MQEYRLAGGLCHPQRHRRNLIPPTSLNAKDAARSRILCVLSFRSCGRYGCCSLGLLRSGASGDGSRPACRDVFPWTVPGRVSVGCSRPASGDCSRPACCGLFPWTVPGRASVGCSWPASGNCPIQLAADCSRLFSRSSSRGPFLIFVPDFGARGQSRPPRNEFSEPVPALYHASGTSL